VSSPAVTVKASSYREKSAHELLVRLGLRGLGPVEPDAPDMIVALMIGELKYQPVLNQITTGIVRTAVELWRSFPSATLVCEAAPMAELAARLGVSPTRLETAIRADRGHTTRKVAKWLQARGGIPSEERFWVITHLLHAERAARVFARCGLRAAFIPLEVPFSAGDPDWKLKSDRMFRMYNHAATLLCQLLRWV